MEDSKRECICTMRPSPEEANAIMDKLTEDGEVAALCSKLEDVLNGNIPRTVLLCMSAVLAASFQGMPREPQISGTLSQITFENLMRAHLNPREIMWVCADVIMRTLVLMEYITQFRSLVGDEEDEPSSEEHSESGWRSDDTST